MGSLLRRGIAFAVTVFALAGFGGAVSAADDGVTFASEHMRLTAYFDDGRVTIAISDGRRFELPRTRAASGARYADGTTVFWNKGDEATLDLDGATYHIQVVDPDADPWERAKRAGVDFRAVGQEPGWFLEIRNSTGVHLVLDYGLTEIMTPLRSLETDYVTATRTYRTGPPTSPVELQIIVEDQVCYDTMSGEER